MDDHFRSGWAQGLYLLAALAAMCGVSVGARAQDQAADSFEIRIGAQAAHIEVTGFSPEQWGVLRDAKWDRDRWLKLLRVSVVSDDEDLPAMLGQWRVAGEVLQFVPRFPLSPNTSYRVTLRPQHVGGHASEAAADQKSIVKVLRVPGDPMRASTMVTAVFPTADVLPENLLRFYIHFSGPMSRGEAYDRVHLFDDAGDEIEYPFLTLDQELWDPGLRRFTLLFDPGRIKRGLKPRELFGPALESGRGYRLVIDAAWTDAQGQPLTGPYVKEFRVVDPDDVQPKVENWRVQPPKSGSREPLVVTFEEPLDHGLLQHMLTVEAPSGEPVRGAVTVGDAETRWQFVPERPWVTGRHAVVANASLEDRAGNSLRRLFEVDVFEKVTQELERDYVRVPFVVKD